MSNVLTRSLARIFKDRARPTSISRLRREGFRTVSVLDLAQLEELIGAAIERVLLQASDDPVQGQRLAADAQIEFLRMLGEKDSLERTTRDLKRERDQLERNLRQMNVALDGARKDLADSLEQHDREALERLCQELDTDLVQILAENTADLDPETAARIRKLQGPLASSMVRILGSAIHRYRPHVAAEEPGTRVETLERRIRKLKAGLTDARSMLGRLRRDRDAEDHGVASIHQEVQGLHGDEEDFAERRKLMTEIFQLNLELRKQIQDQAPTPGAP